MKSLTLILSCTILMFCNVLIGQVEPCGVPSNLEPYPIELFKKLKEKHKSYKSDGILNIPVKAHAIRKPNSSPGLTYKPKLLSGINQANKQVDHLGIRFMLCDQVNVINDREYGFVTYDIGHELHLEHRIDGAVNLYIGQSLDTGGGGACGWATLPWWDRDYDYIFMAEACMDDNTTLAHEVGHYLGLFHTHNVMDSMVLDSVTMDSINIGIEFVDQSNCEYAGDGLCDTAADPLLRGRNVSRSCVYNGDEKDPLGVPYSEAEVLPDPRNRMSYAPFNCHEVFSEGQNEVMRIWLAERIPELTCKGDPDFELNNSLFNADAYYAGADINIMMDLAMYSFYEEAPSPNISVYLSKNGIIDSTDVVIYNGGFPEYLVNSEFKHEINFTLPENFEAVGVHFLLLHIDSDEAYPELSEGNNFMKQPIFVEGAPSANQNLIDSQALTLYPNPILDHCTVSGLDLFENKQIIIEIYNMVGVHSHSLKTSIQSGEIHCKTGFLFPGHYTMKFVTLEGQQIASKTFIRK